MPIHLISDGGSDLPLALREQWDIQIVPLGVQFGSVSYDSNMNTTDFYQEMKKAAELPKTSSPAPHAFMKAFQSVPVGEPIIVITLSSALSSTYQHAVLARQMYVEDTPGVGEIEIIDSLTASMGLGLIVYQAAQLAKEGLSFKAVVERIKNMVKETKTEFVLDTLENVIKGGRLDRVRGAVASMLNIKLLMHASEEGAVEVLEKVRGSSNAVKRLVQRLEQIKDEAGDRILAVAHSNCEEKAAALVRTIAEKYTFREVVISEMGPVIGTYAGEGGVLVAY